MSEQEFIDVLYKINGVVFPGGGNDFIQPTKDGGSEWDAWVKKANIIFTEAMKMKLKGDYFPILGICQGH